MSRKVWRMSVHRWTSKFTPAGDLHCTTETIFHFTTCPGDQTSNFCWTSCLFFILQILWEINEKNWVLGISSNLSSWFVRLPDVYTQFRKAVETQSEVRPVFPTPEQLKPLPQGLEEGAIPTAEDLQQTGELCLCTSTKLIFTCEDWCFMFHLIWLPFID